MHPDFDQLLNPGLLSEVFGISVVSIPIALCMLYARVSGFRWFVNTAALGVLWAPYWLVVASGVAVVLLLYCGLANPAVLWPTLSVAAVLGVVVFLRWYFPNQTRKVLIRASHYILIGIGAVVGTLGLGLALIAYCIYRAGYLLWRWLKPLWQHVEPEAKPDDIETVP